MVIQYKQRPQRVYQGWPTQYQHASLTPDEINDKVWKAITDKNNNMRKPDTWDKRITAALGEGTAADSWIDCLLYSQDKADQGAVEGYEMSSWLMDKKISSFVDSTQLYVLGEDEDGDDYCQWVIYLSREVSAAAQLIHWTPRMAAEAVGIRQHFEGAHMGYEVVYRWFNA